MMHLLRRPWTRTALLSGLAAGGAYAATRTHIAYASQPPPSPTSVLPRREYTTEEVRAHAGNGNSVWVSFNGKVYDITDFVEMHPGGNQILQAAGGPLEPFFALYAQHNEPFVLELLEEYRIGDLADAHTKPAVNHDPYAADPSRNERLVVRSQKPFNAEPSLKDLVCEHVTPNGLFYVRNHLPVPAVDAETYRLVVRDVDGTELASLSMEQLRKLPKHQVAVTLQCAGNRRDEMRAVRDVKGGHWGAGAIGNAVWGGVRLVDVVPADKLNKVRHVCFEGLDMNPTDGAAYGASVPADVGKDVILAYEMNGEPLPRDHGYPVRAVAPGVVGARSVKWLGEVRLSMDESSSHWQRRDYKSFSPAVDWDNICDSVWDSAPSIQEAPVVSAICDARRVGDKVIVEGYAWSGGGRAIIRVDVSTDDGETWSVANLREKTEEQRNQVYDWTLWSAEVPLADTKKDTTIVCKAIDSAYNTQPERLDAIWNLRGLLNNAWHRVVLAEN